MSSNTEVLSGGTAVSPSARWIQLGLGIICMMAISSPQYVWALFTKPLGAALAVSPAALQVTFSLLIVLQTFFSPIQGWLVDRYGPRLLIAVGGLLSGFGWVLSAYATSLWALYFSYGIVCGIGTGIVYIGVVGQVVRWFPESRGFAAGMVAAGYGMGAIATTFPISASIADAGYQATLLRYGIVFAVIGVIAALGLRPPPASNSVKAVAIAGVSSAVM